MNNFKMDIFEHYDVNFLPIDDREACDILNALNKLPQVDPYTVGKLVHFHEPKNFATALPGILFDLQQQAAEAGMPWLGDSEAIY
jgi:hypothetical protein